MGSDSVTSGLHAGLTRKIIGVYYSVYNELGFGFLESVYQESMSFALLEAGLRCARETVVPVAFRGRLVGEFRPDLVVENAVVVELKACRSLVPAHNAQVINYLRATPYEVGLLLNFGPEPRVRRFVFAATRKCAPR